MPPYFNIKKIAILQLLLFFTGPDFAYGRSEACGGRATNQKVPEEGQVFYIQYESKWRYVLIDTRSCAPNCNTATNGEGLSSEWSYPKLKLVESGKYKYKWHDCYDGKVILELISNGPDYYYQPGGGAVRSLDACNDDRIRKYPKSDLKKGWVIYDQYKFYIPPTCQTFATVGSHCNCGSVITDWQFTVEKGISNAEKTGDTLSSKEVDEVSTGIKASARESTTAGIKTSASVEAEAGAFFASVKATASVEGSVSGTLEESSENSSGSRFSTEVGLSWLSETSSTWSQKTRKTITIRIPPNKCMGLFQKIGHYGPYQVGSSRTINRERRPKSFEC